MRVYVIDKIVRLSWSILDNKNTLLSFCILGCIALGLYMASICLMLFMFLFMIKGLIEDKQLKIRTESCDMEAPNILRSVIEEAINQYYLYNFAGMAGTPYINNEQELEINHGVVDILVPMLHRSALADKLRMYYGDNYMDIVATNINLHVTNFVIGINTAPPTKKKGKTIATTREDIDEDAMELIKSLGINLRSSRELM